MLKYPIMHDIPILAVLYHFSITLSWAWDCPSPLHSQNRNWLVMHSSIILAELTTNKRLSLHFQGPELTGTPPSLTRTTVYQCLQGLDTVPHQLKGPLQFFLGHFTHSMVGYCKIQTVEWTEEGVYDLVLVTPSCTQRKKTSSSFPCRLTSEFRYWS